MAAGGCLQSRSVFPSCAGPCFHAGCLRFWNITDANKARPKEPLSCVHQIKFPLLGTRAACACYSADSRGTDIFIHNHPERSKAETQTRVWDPLPFQYLYFPPQIRAFSPFLFSYFQISAKSRCLKFSLPSLLPRAREQLRHHGHGQHSRDSTRQNPTRQKFLLSKATLALQPGFRAQQKALLFRLMHRSLEDFCVLGCRKRFPAATG